MQDQIDAWIQRIDTHSTAFKDSFSDSSPSILNTRPTPSEWSVAQCIDHLIKTNEKYFAIFQSVNSGIYKNPFLGKIPGYASFIGGMLLKAVGETVNRKSSTFPPFEPSQSDLDGDILKKFLNQQEKLKDLFLSLKSVDLEKVIITSPVNKMIVYSLKDACEIVVSHEGRHLGQARRVLERTQNE